MIDFPAIAAHLLPDALTLLREWLPAGKLHGREYKCGSLSGEPGESLSVNIDSGKWADFATGKGGIDLLALYAAIHGINNVEAAKRLTNGHADAIEDFYITSQQCHPIPRHKHGKPSGIWEYKNVKGETLGYVCRFDVLNGGKEFAPLTAWLDAKGNIKWKWKKWSGANPIYGADRLTANPAAKVLIVEGEKTADAAQKLLPDWVVVTWPGGSGAVKQCDWSALKERFCWCWPDKDDPGIKAAEALKKILPHMQIVTLDPDWPEGWDLGDAPEDFDPLPYLKAHQVIKQLSLQEAEAAVEGRERRKIKFTHIDDRNKILATIENMRDLFNARNIVCRYNVISKRVMFTIPGESFSSENVEDAALACIYSYMKEDQMPVDGYLNYTLRIADENQYNPAMDFILSKPWDGIDRLQALYDTIESPEKEAKELLIRRWLITCVCMAKGEGVDSAGCLVLQGPQDLGKTWWVRKLVPESVRKELIRTDATVDPKDKDSVSQTIAYWIVELGEIGATFRKADIDALKAFITRDHDTMRRPYGIGDKRYPRRTALVASVDQTIYLHDTAGNRRFWTIPCTAINSYHEIDMQQLWAQVLTLVEAGETWRLEPDEKAHIARINEEHMQIDPIYEMILEKYRWDELEYVAEWKTATQIATDIGLKNVTVKETRLISSHICKLNKGEKKKQGSQRLLMVPAKRIF